MTWISTRSCPTNVAAYNAARSRQARERTRNEYFGAEAGREGIYTYLWPNFMLNVYPDGGNASTNLIVPIDEHHCLAVYEFFFSETMPEEEQRTMVDFIDQVQREDIIIVESVQRGLRFLMLRYLERLPRN